MYQLAHIGIRVADLDRARKFYCDALGGVPAQEHQMPSGSHLLFVNFADFSLELICKPDDDRTPGRNHLAIQVSDIRAAVRRIAECGFTADENDIKPMGNTALNCFLNGPDGEIVELCEGRL